MVAGNDDNTRQFPVEKIQELRQHIITHKDHVYDIYLRVRVLRKLDAQVTALHETRNDDKMALHSALF